jgi:Cyclic nucleotide-binding domain/Major Facilitator Superfamily
MKAIATFFTGRSGMFFVLAFLLAAQNSYASTFAASLFLSKVGAEAIPLYYVLFAIVSIPTSTIVSRVIDRFPRHLIFKCMLGIFVAISLAMSTLLDLGSGWYYVVYVGISVCEQLLYSIYYVLFSDYFTVVEAKRATGRVTIGMALGGLAGGAGVVAVESLAGPRLALLLTPILVGIVVVYFASLTRLYKPVGAIEPAADESLVESLRVVPRLLARYPMVALMAGAMFLNVLLQCLSEYLAFSIYTLHYPRIEELALFLGTVNAGLNMLGFAIVILFTDPALKRFGVATMNRIYPALNVMSFGVMTTSTSLPAGILAHIAYDPFVHSIDVPVSTMNYNAIRHRLVGRVRVFVDGVVYPLALALAGGLLVLFQHSLGLRQIAGIGFAISLLLLLVHWQIGTHYVRGLLGMLRDGALDLEASVTSLRLPAEAIAEIRALLAGDQRAAYAGLQMALRCEHEFPAEEIGPALATIPAAQAREILTQFAHSPKAERRQTFVHLADSKLPAVRRLGLEMMARTGARTNAGHRALLDDADEGVRSIVAAAILADAPSDPAALAILNGPLAPNCALAAIAVLQERAGERAAGILEEIGQHGDADVRAASLQAAGAASAHKPAVLAWARRAQQDDAPPVRAAAYPVLVSNATVHDIDGIVAAGLGDGAPQVREALVAALQDHGDGALPPLYRQLYSAIEETQLAAIDALGRILGIAAEGGLYAAFETEVFPAIRLHRQLADMFRPGRRGWAAMGLALDNAKEHTLRVVMHGLEALGHRKVLAIIRKSLNDADERARANAIESLALLPQRRFVAPLTPLLEGWREAHADDAFDATEALRLLQLAALSPDPGLRAAAAVAWHAETGEITDASASDASPLVAETAQRLRQGIAPDSPYQQEAPMNRLTFLHSVPLFAKASLDDLIVIDRTISCETYVRGEEIVTEGDTGDRLCIVYRGEVAVRKRMPDGERELARLGSGDFFGEMSLFDDEPRSATVAAIDEVEVLVLNRDRFHSLVQQRPAILMEMCATLVQRLRKAVR